MKLGTLRCSGVTHRIGVDAEGKLVLFDHDVDAELVAIELGAAKPDCLIVAGLLAPEGNVIPGALKKSMLLAVRQVNVQLIELLLDLGADIHVGDYNTRTGHIDQDFAVIFAATYALPDLLRLLIRRGANVHARDRFGPEAALRSVITQHGPGRGVDELKSLSITYQLLEAGADIYAENVMGESILGLAFENLSPSARAIIGWHNEHSK